jgi:hypothetical protein
MAKNKLKPALITSLALAIVACTNTVPNNTLPDADKSKLFSQENFQDLDQEYTFSTLALAKSYLTRKLRRWLYESGDSANGPKLVKELLYGKFKYPDTLCEVIAENEGMLQDIKNVDEVSRRQEFDPDFNSFIISLENCHSGEARVNTYTQSHQRNPAVAMDDGGDYIVVWQSYNQEENGVVSTGFRTKNLDYYYSNPYGGYGIYAQRYFANGDRNGEEFLVNSFTDNVQRNPAVAMDDSGDFVIAWQSYYQEQYSYNGEGGTYFKPFYYGYYGIFAKKYHANGNVQIPAGCALPACDPEAGTGEFMVNTFISGDQQAPAVAMDDNGDFVITWESRYLEAYEEDTFGTGYGLYARRFNNDGSAKDNSEFRVNEVVRGNQQNPTIAMDGGGDFVIAWETNYNGEGTSQDGSRYGIFARKYNVSGGNITGDSGEFKVNEYTTHNQRNPAAAMDDSGDFVIAWESYGQEYYNPESYYYGYGIFARRYSNNAQSIDSSEFRVNFVSRDLQRFPSVSMDNNGDFVVAWESYRQEQYTFEGEGGTYTGNYATYGVFARRYEAVNGFQGSEFQVNTYYTNNQRKPSVALDDAGDFVIAWESGYYSNSNSQDGSYYGIYHQRYDAAGNRQHSEEPPPPQIFQ